MGFNLNDEVYRDRLDKSQDTRIIPSRRNMKKQEKLKSNNSANSKNTKTNIKLEE